MSEFGITYRGTVFPWQCNHMGHMNVMWYKGKFDEASWQLLSSVGLTRSRFRKEGAGMAAVEQHIEYNRELHAGDIVTIRSAILEVRDKSIRLRHQMTNDETGDVAAITTIVVHLDIGLRKARSLPSDVHTRAAAMMSMWSGSDGGNSNPVAATHIGSPRSEAKLEAAAAGTLPFSKASPPEGNDRARFDALSIGGL